MKGAFIGNNTADKIAHKPVLLIKIPKKVKFVEISIGMPKEICISPKIENKLLINLDWYKYNTNRQ